MRPRLGGHLALLMLAAASDDGGHFYNPIPEYRPEPRRWDWLRPELARALWPLLLPRYTKAEEPRRLERDDDRRFLRSRRG